MMGEENRINVEEEVDRISLLPEPILHHILSSLLAKEAIQIAPTCKRLNQVWATFPRLDLGKDFFPIVPQSVPKSIFDEEDDESEDSKKERRMAVMREREKLFTFVEQTLANWRMLNLTTHKFQLGWTKMDVELSQRLDSWVSILVQHCNIKELKLQGDLAWYNLPSILLTATSLRALTLSYCIMPCGGPMDLSSLKQMVLSNVHLSEKFLLDIINTCHGLEKLVICSCPGLQKRIFVPGKSHLKTLHLTPSMKDEVDEVVIEANHLETLIYSAVSTRPIKINIITDSGGSCLKCLHLCCANITNTWFCELISRLSRLEELKLLQLSLKSIQISSSSLKRLVLSRVFSYRDIKFGEFVIDTPKLVHLTYRGDLLSVFRNSMAVKEVHIVIDDFRRKRPSEQLCVELMQFMKNFDYSEAVSLDCTCFEDMIFPPEMRLNVHTPPLAHVKYFALEGMFRSSPIDALAKLYNVLRWIAPNVDSLSLKHGRYWKENPIDLIKFTAGECDCFVSPPLKCKVKCTCLPMYELKGSNAALVNALRDYLVESFKDIHGCDS